VDRVGRAAVYTANKLVEGTFSLVFGNADTVPLFGTSPPRKIKQDSTGELDDKIISFSDKPSLTIAVKTAKEKQEELRRMELQRQIDGRPKIKPARNWIQSSRTSVELAKE